MGFFVHTPMLVLAILVSHMTHFLIHMDEKSHTQVRKQNVPCTSKSENSAAIEQNNFFLTLKRVINPRALYCMRT